MEPHERLMLKILDAAERMGGERLLSELEDHGMIEMIGMTDDGQPTFVWVIDEEEEDGSR